MFFDALRVEIREDAVVATKRCTLALGVWPTAAGTSWVFGSGAPQGANF